MFGMVFPFSMYGFYCNFDNLRFRNSQNTNDCSAAHVLISVVSSEILKCTWLKSLLDHSMLAMRSRMRALVRGMFGVVLLTMGASESGFFEVRLPSLRA